MPILPEIILHAEVEHQPLQPGALGPHQGRGADQYYQTCCCLFNLYMCQTTYRSIKLFPDPFCLFSFISSALYARRQILQFSHISVSYVLNQNFLVFLQSTWVKFKFCAMYLPTERNLFNHVAHLHEAPKAESIKVTCPYCPRAFNAPHIEKHCKKIHFDTVEAEWFKCDPCKRYFRSEASITLHNKKVHPNRDEKKLGKNYSDCPFCNLQVLGLFAHYNDNRIDVISQSWHLCDLCGLYIPIQSINGHKQTHEKYNCQFCDRLLKANPGQFIHENTGHLYKVSVLWIKCSDCHLFFPTEEDVVVHRKRNHERIKKPFTKK